MTKKEYSLPADLLQAIVAVLNDQPAKITRGILNAVEHYCTEQDKPVTVAEDVATVL